MGDGGGKLREATRGRRAVRSVEKEVAMRVSTGVLMMAVNSVTLQVVGSARRRRRRRRQRQSGR